MAYKAFPRVLIIGEPINSLSGTGITLYNFFKDWPRDRLAVAAGNNIWRSDFSFCQNLFKIKNHSIFRNIRFISSFLKDDETEGPLYLHDFEIQQMSKNSTNPKVDIFIKKKLKHLFKLLGNLTGLSPVIYRLLITKELDDWIKTFNPEVLYTFLNHYEQLQFVLDLHVRYKIPFIVHLMDDHILMMPPQGMLYLYWQKKMNSKFFTLLNKATIRMSICQYMSDIYYKRYGLEFTAYHNPVELNSWLPYSKINWKCSGVFKILYAGRWGFDNARLLSNLAAVVEQMNKNGFNIQLDLRLGAISVSKEIKGLKKLKNTRVLDYVPHNEMNSIISEYDLLYFPLGFDKKTKKIYSVSMSTKISEYMISGVPILVHAPEYSAYYYYANEGKWGYVLKSKKKNDLINSLVELIQDERLREYLGLRAKSLAIQNHNAEIIRDNFRSEFIKASTARA